MVILQVPRSDLQYIIPLYTLSFHFSFHVFFHVFLLYHGGTMLEPYALHPMYPHNPLYGAYDPFKGTLATSTAGILKSPSKQERLRV